MCWLRISIQTFVYIKCEYVNGFTKDEVRKHPERAPTDSNHASNTIQIGQYWYLAEPTWASGYLTNNSTKFVQCLDFYYFLIRPDEFIYSHLPKINKWQHLNDSINLIQYSQLPDVYPAYFGLQLELINSRMQSNVTLLPGRSFAFVIMRVPSHVYISARLTLNDREIPGEHKNRHFGHRLGRKKSALNETSFEPAMTFVFKVDYLESPISYPKLFQQFYDRALRLLSPTSQARLICNEDLNTAQVCIHAPANIQFNCHTEFARKILKDASFFQCNTDKQQWEFLFAPQCATMHHLINSAQSDDGQFQKVAQVYLNISRYFYPTSFPYTYPSFHTAQCYIYEPLKVRLQFSATILFRYHLPGVNEVIVEIDEDQNTSYPLNESLFHQTIKIGYRTLIIHARFDKNYETLVKYFVIQIKDV